MSFKESDITIGYKDLSFDGLRFFWSNENMPWNNKRQRKNYLDGLVDEGTEFSSNRYKALWNQIGEREIHVKVSQSIAAKVFAIVLMGFAFLFAVKGLLFVGLATLGVSFVLYNLNKFFERRSNELYAGLLQGSEMVDFLFASDETL